MTVMELIDSNIFHVVNRGTQTHKEITSIFCCDLLSVAMGKAKSGCAWVTVMANINTLAVSLLVEAACIVIAENTEVDEQFLERAEKEGITIFRTNQPIFESAAAIAEMCNA